MDQKVMFRLGYGLYVLTAKDTKENGCILNTVMQVTSEPNQIIMAINKANLTHDMILNTRTFNVSVLTTEVPFSVIQQFGYQSGRDVDKFMAYMNIERAENGIYYITEGTNAYLSAAVSEIYDCGSHSIFLSKVTDGRILREETSLTYQFYQDHIKPKPHVTEEVKGYVCTICGYIHEGEKLPKDFVCPVCKHGAEDFKVIEDKNVRVEKSIL